MASSSNSPSNLEPKILLPLYLTFFGLHLFLLGSAQAQEPLEARLTKIERRLDEMQAKPSENNEELTRIRMEMQLPEAVGVGFMGMGPALSRVYSSHSPISLGALGEINYVSQEGGERRTNLARLSPILGVRLARNLIVNSSFSFESGGGPSGSSRVDFAYVDFLFNESSGLRVGHLLIPFGATNLNYEPTSYFSVDRSRPETRIVPTIWHENGAMGFGRAGSVEIQGGIFNSGNAQNLTQDSWISGSRQFGSNAKASSAAVALRAEIVEVDRNLGASLYIGNQSQGEPSLADSKVVLAAVHGSAKADRFSIKGLYTEGTLSDTGRIFAITGRSIGARARGFEIEVAYDLLPRIGPIARAIAGRGPTADDRELPIFLSWERDNVYAEPAEGQTPSDRFQNDTYTLGVNYKPHPQIAVKLNYQLQTTPASPTQRAIELGLGFAF